MADGRKFEAKLLGADPRLEVAVLKIEAAGLPCFDLAKAAKVDAGARVLAFSNLFGVATGNEPASVQKGTDLGRDAAGGPPRRVRDALSRPGLRARRDDEQPRRRRRGAGDAPRRVGRHAGQGTPQRAEQHLAELRRAHRRAAPVGRGDPRRQVRRPRARERPETAARRSIWRRWASC